MQISGICYIANKYQSQDKDFKRFERFATGKISWGDNIKGKDGVVTKSYTNKQFICFDTHVIDVLDGCQKDLLIIEGQLRTESYIDKEGNKKSIEKVVIAKAKIYEKKQDVAPEPQQNEIKQEVKEEIQELDDDIPF
jgi:hypothetical protein